MWICSHLLFFVVWIGCVVSVSCVSGKFACLLLVSTIFLWLIKFMGSSSPTQSSKMMDEHLIKFLNEMKEEIIQKVTTQFDKKNWRA